jgi:hypothetical protein
MTGLRSFGKSWLPPPFAIESHVAATPPLLNVAKAVDGKRTVLADLDTVLRNKSVRSRVLAFEQVAMFTLNRNFERMHPKSYFSSVRFSKLP